MIYALLPSQKLLKTTPKTKIKYFCGVFCKNIKGRGVSKNFVLKFCVGTSRRFLLCHSHVAKRVKSSFEIVFGVNLYPSIKNSLKTENTQNKKDGTIPSTQIIIFYCMWCPFHNWCKFGVNAFLKMRETQ